jgi:predicted membrane-bound spermidine synthase
LNTNYRLLVFLVAASTLMFELVASRLADFHLGAGNAYLAIPITFLGLALGSLHVHSRPEIVDRFRPFTALAILTSLCFLAVLAVFCVFSRLLPVVSALQVTETRLYLLNKTLAFIGVLLPPFYYFGRILTVVYQIKREEIGAVYSADFWGAALACAITPVLFHLGGLPNVSLVLLGLTCAPLLIFFRGGPPRRVLLGVICLVACVSGARVITALDDSVDFSRYSDARATFTEVTHGWNEHSRVALLSRQPDRAGVKSYKIVHDNSRSNVHVTPYLPRRVGRAPGPLEALEVPGVLPRPIKAALVVFAGCGSEMVKINEVLGGTADISGLELNPLVRDLAVNSSELERYNLQEFYDLPHINLIIDEGRHFLSRTSEKYDLIFVGSNAATGVWLTGHSRKYLDTIEAFHLYLDHLSDSGMIIFDHQPVERHIESMKLTFAERGIRDFPNRVVILDSLTANDDMLVSPAGFSDDEIRRLLAATKGEPERVRYAPRRENNLEYYSRLIEGSPSIEQAMTDDRPFMAGVYWKDYKFLPTDEDVRSRKLYLSWIKISTLLILVAISVLFIVVTVMKRSADLPPSVLAYLLITGFCFMLIEIALIAKLELFLQKPIVSMATVLSTFLVTSGIGSHLFAHIKKRIRIGILSLVVAALSLAWTHLLDFLNSSLLGLPIPAKLVVALGVTAPVGICLGLFYPYAVSCLVHNERPRAVAISYGISTLSSVIGATYAMTMMLDWGFSSLLRQAGAGYVLLAVLVQLYSTVLRGRYLTL